jgi:hypothetical protein
MNTETVILTQKYQIDQREITAMSTNSAHQAFANIIDVSELFSERNVPLKMPVCGILIALLKELAN